MEEQRPFEIIADEKTLQLITSNVRAICKEDKPDYVRVKRQIVGFVFDEVVAYNTYLLALNQVGPRRYGAIAIITALRHYLPEDFWENDIAGATDWVKKVIMLPRKATIDQVQKLYDGLYAL